MNDHALPEIATRAEARLVNKERLFVAVLLGFGGIVTFSWVTLIAWAVIYLIGSVTG